MYNICITLLGEILHFNDPATDLFYFLDVKWVFSSMINIARMPCSNDGKILVLQCVSSVAMSYIYAQKYSMLKSGLKKIYSKDDCMLYSI